MTKSEFLSGLQNLVAQAEGKNYIFIGKNPKDVVERIWRILTAQGDKVTETTMSLSRNALATETAQLETNLAGLKSLVSLKKGLLGLGSANKKTAARGPDKEAGEVMLNAAGGETRS